MMRKRRITAVLLVLVLLALTACAKGSAETATPGLLEFPGLHWNDTPETVRTFLGSAGAKIVADEQANDDADTYDLWGIAVSDLTCFGVQVQTVGFNFARYNGEEYGLVNVEIYYPDGADMTAVEKAMSELYGPSTTQKPVSYTIYDGKLEESTSSGKLELTNGATFPADAMHVYWVSDVNGKDFLSEQEQQKMVAYLTGLQTQSIQEETAMEWLEKNPLVEAYCTDASLLYAITGGTASNVTNNYVLLQAEQLVYLKQNFG